MIVPRESRKVELDEDEEEYDEYDVRNMSPKRSIEDVERLTRNCRAHLLAYVRRHQPGFRLH